MTFSGDPYRTLGLAPGATLDDVKRAYRRLAKQYHPDAAGPGATDRFLAIQGAYEALVGPARRRTPGRPATRPSQADPDRARATRDAWRARRGAAYGSRPGSGASDGAGTAGSADPWRGGTRRPPDADTGRPSGGPGEDARRTAGAAPGSGAPGPRPSGRAPGTGSGDRRGSRRKATLNSTSYDDAAREPRHPDWQGSSWYGTSSGTYWTINPREFADPRKHGPEYQARARRAAADAGPPQRERARPDPAGPSGGASASASASASFAGGAGEGAWSDAGSLRHGTRAAAGAGPGSAGARTDGPSDQGSTTGPRSEDGPSGVPTAGSIGLLAGALAAIPSAVVALASIMSGDLSLAAGAIVVPFGVALVAGLAAGIRRGMP